MNKNILLIIAVAVMAGLLVFVGSLIGKPSVNPVVIESPDIKFGSLTSPDIISPYLSVNGLASYVANGECLDATTTLFAVLNPTGATSTVEFLSFSGVGATSTYALFVGTTTSRYISNGIQPFGSTGGNSINGVTIATSTWAHIVGGYNTVTRAHPVAAGGSTVATFPIGPAEYVVGLATSTSEGSNWNAIYRGGITGKANTFTCTYKIRFIR